MREVWNSSPTEKYTAALLEAARLLDALAQRTDRRLHNRVGIERKLAVDTSGDVTLSPRKRARLERELGFLTTYDTRHLTRNEAVQKHVWIQFGLNYTEAMNRHAM